MVEKPKAVRLKVVRQRKAAFAPPEPPPFKRYAHIALDLGSIMGAYGTNFARPISMELGYHRNTNRMMKLHNLLLWLDKVLEHGAPAVGPYELISFERPFVRGQAATRMLWGIAGVIEALAYKHGCKVYDATPAEIKYASTGNGHASKEQMIEAAVKYGYGALNDHEADALHLYHMVENNRQRCYEAAEGKRYVKHNARKQRKKNVQPAPN